MQKLPNPFNWYPLSSWVWPDDDIKLRQVNDWVADIDRIMLHVEHQGLAVQAGGACGIWPARLAGLFDRVVTCEPQPDNYACLVSNLQPYTNVVAHRLALGPCADQVNLHRDEFETGNAGAWYVVPGPGEQVRVVALDSLSLPACDLICLDVEGAELGVIIGAQQTIEKFHPVVVIECKQLPHMDHDATLACGYLKSLGYRQVEKIHNDRVFKWRS